MASPRLCDDGDDETQAPWAGDDEAQAPWAGDLEEEEGQAQVPDAGSAAAAGPAADDGAAAAAVPDDGGALFVGCITDRDVINDLNGAIRKADLLLVELGDLCETLRAAQRRVDAAKREAEEAKRKAEADEGDALREACARAKRRRIGA